MHPAFFQEWKISTAVFPPSVGREKWIPAENRKMLHEKHGSERISAFKNSRFCFETPFSFYMEKHLIKEVNNFWCRDCDCASTVIHSFEKFNTRMFLNIYFKIVSLLPQKHLISPLNCHFVSSWKSTDWKSWYVFDGAITIVCRLLQNYVRNSAEGFS